MSDYGDYVSEVESVGSQFQEEREEEEKQKKLFKEGEEDDIQKEEKVVFDKYALFEEFRGKIFQDVSNDKMYIITIKKSKDN